LPNALHSRGVEKIMNKLFLKNIVEYLGIKPKTIIDSIAKWSLNKALHQNGFYSRIERLQSIVPNISDQYSREQERNGYWNLNVRGLHAFQTFLMEKALDGITKDDLTVVDIGDSAGTHMTYLANIIKDRKIDTVSVNLDQRAIDKITSKGLKALLCRAEELQLDEGKQVDLFTSFEMVEHLHNPAIFFYRLAKKSPCNKLLITVPYLKHSRVGLHYIRNRSNETIFAEDEHIFELSPNDWRLLLLHSGWKVTYSEIYFQYPQKWPVISQFLAFFWRKTDFEGFWGAIMEKDTSLSDLYQDWE
jgi:hypothetical protein